jgi:membrane protease YdiL (CAAX protease family)
VEISEIDEGKVWSWVFGSFLLAMIVRVPMVLYLNMAYEKIAVIYFIALVIVLVFDSKPCVFGLKTEKFAKALGIGLLYYFIFEFTSALSLLILTFYFTGDIVFVSYNPSLFLLFFPYAVLCIGVSEEGLFRGFMQTLLQKIYSVKKAIFVQSVLFGLWHFVWHISPLNLAGITIHMVYTFVVGLLFGYFYSIAENLTPLILMHGLIDSFPLGYVFNQEVINKLKSFSPLSQFLVYALPYTLSITLMFMLTKKLAEKVKAP